MAGSPKPWKPFRPREIRLFGTLKTTNDPEIKKKPYGRKKVNRGNCLDTVRGCPFGAAFGGRGCYGMCYACEAVKRYHVLYHVPVPGILREDLLRRDLAECQDSWVRIGILGEPSCDWNLTIRVAEICREAGKDVIILTRVAQVPTDEQLRRLAGVGAVLSISVWGLDPEHAWRERLEVAKRYIQLGGKAVIRFISFAFKNPEENRRQEERAEEAQRLGITVVEQPGRIQRTNPIFWEHLDQGAYKPYGSYTDPSIHRWLCAGRRLNGGSLVCNGHCPDCDHKCGLYPRRARGDGD